MLLVFFFNEHSTVVAIGGDGDAHCFFKALMLNICIINVMSWSTYGGLCKCYALFLVLIYQCDETH